MLEPSMTTATETTPEPQSDKNSIPEFVVLDAPGFQLS